MTVLKIIFVVLLALSIIPVSIIAMIWGWGLSPQNWGWIAFGYLWVVMAPIISGVISGRWK